MSETGIVYDEDSSAFGAKNEDEAGKALGEENYQKLCQKFPNTGKPTRARLISLEEGTAIPPPVEDIRNWLAGHTKAAARTGKAPAPAPEEGGASAASGGTGRKTG